MILPDHTTKQSGKYLTSIRHPHIPKHLKHLPQAYVNPSDKDTDYTAFLRVLYYSDETKMFCSSTKL